MGALPILLPQTVWRSPDPEENIRTDTIYLGNGSVDHVKDEVGKITEYETDKLGRLISVSDPEQHTTTYLYDANGNRTLVTDAKGVSTKYAFDSLNRLKVVIENYREDLWPNKDNETNVTTEYTYDAGGNRLSILDGSGHLTEFNYTDLGLLEKEKDALDHETAYQYDAMGNRIHLLDAERQETFFKYDAMNRLHEIDYGGNGVDVTFWYDQLGHRTSMTDELGTTTWDPNNIDLPNSITGPSPSNVPSNVSYDYDAVGNRTSLTYPDTSEVKYHYNALNRLTTVTRGQSALANYQYDAVGRVKTVSRPNGVNTPYNYYDNGWLQDITHSAETTILGSYQYQYDRVGNRTQAIENILHPAPSLQSGEFISSAPQEEIVPTAPETALPVATVMPAPTQPTPQETPSSFTYTSQPDGGTGEDTYLLSKSANKNYGDEMELEIGESSAAQDEVARGLIRFDLSSIPANAVVTSAWLSLWPAVDSAENDRTIRVYRLKTGFEEAGATWQEAAAGVRWEAEGASGLDDRENAAIGSAPILGSEPVGVEKQIMLSTSKVEEWIDGTFANHGLLVVVETELDDRFSYESSELACRFEAAEAGDPLYLAGRRRAIRSGSADRYHPSSAALHGGSPSRPERLSGTSGRTFATR